MLEECAQHAGRDDRHVRTGCGTRRETRRARRAGRRDVAFRGGVVEGRAELADQVRSALSDGFQRVDRDRDHRRAGLRREDALRARIDEGGRDPNAVVGELPDGGNRVLDEGHGDDQVVHRLRQVARALVDVGRADRGNARADRKFRCARNLRDHVAGVRGGKFGRDDCGRRDHAVDQRGSGGPTDFVERRGGEEDAHRVVGRSVLRR